MYRLPTITRAAHPTYLPNSLLVSHSSTWADAKDHQRFKNLTWKKTIPNIKVRRQSWRNLVFFPRTQWKKIKLEAKSMIVDHSTWISDFPEGRKSLSEPFVQTERLSSTADEKRSTPKYIIVKFLNTEVKEKIYKLQKWKRNLTCRWSRVRIAASFSKATPIKIMKESDFQLSLVECRER